MEFILLLYIYKSGFSLGWTRLRIILWGSISKNSKHSSCLLLCIFSIARLELIFRITIFKITSQYYEAGCANTTSFNSYYCSSFDFVFTDKQLPLSGYLIIPLVSALSLGSGEILILVKAVLMLPKSTYNHRCGLNFPHWGVGVQSLTQIMHCKWETRGSATLVVTSCGVRCLMYFKDKCSWMYLCMPCL